MGGGLARLDVAQAVTHLPSPMDDLRVLDRGGQQGSHGQETSEHLNVVRHAPILPGSRTTPNHP